jgi:hypothetical protein
MVLPPWVGGDEVPKGFDLRCSAGKTASVWLQGDGGSIKPGEALVLLPPPSNETAESLVAYMVPLRHALIDGNKGHVNLVVCESDQAWNRALAAHAALAAHLNPSGV